MDPERDSVTLPLSTSRDDPRTRRTFWIIAAVVSVGGLVIGATTEIRPRSYPESGGPFLWLAACVITFGAVWLIIRRTSREPGAMIISAAEVRIDVPRAFKTPFLIPIAMIRAAAVDDGAAHGTTRDRKTKRFALAVEGPGSTGAARGRPEWLFSWRGGGLLDIPIVNREPVVPNLVLLFVDRIPGPEAKRGSGLMFSRSRLIHAAGAGEIPGVFAEVRDPNGARMALGRLGVLAPIRLSDLYDLQPPELKRKLGPLN